MIRKKRKLNIELLKRYNTKAQMVGQVLIYILAIVVFASTLIYGYKAAKYFTEQSNKISFLQLEDTINNEVKLVKGDSMGTVKKKTFAVPGRYEKICFVKSFEGFPKVNIDTEYDMINDHINSNATDKNMFLAPPGDISFLIEDILVNNNVDCIDITGGKITLRLESMGDHVKLSSWE